MALNPFHGVLMTHISPHHQSSSIWIPNSHVLAIKRCFLPRSAFMLMRLPVSRIPNSGLILYGPKNTFPKPNTSVEIAITTCPNDPNHLGLHLHSLYRGKGSMLQTLSMTCIQYVYYLIICLIFSLMSNSMNLKQDHPICYWAIIIPSTLTHPPLPSNTPANPSFISIFTYPTFFSGSYSFWMTDLSSCTL